MFGDCLELMFSFKSWLSFESTVWHQISCQGKFLVDGFLRSFENMEGWKKVLGGSGSQRGYGMGMGPNKAMWVYDGL